MEPEVLEDGEIRDIEEPIGDIVDNYVVLERPPNYSSTLAQPRFREKEEEESEYEMTSPSDSDSDSCAFSGVKAKRIKHKLKPLAKNNVRKKNDIWSTRVQEDVLLENLVNCDVSKVDRSRNVETYPVPNYNSNRYKRSFDDRYQSNLRKNNLESNDVNDASRIILETHVTVADSEIDVAKDIANKLYETNEDLILNIVTVIGKEKALDLFKKTKTIEENGGMMILDRSRRRTPGGVYLFLVKSDTNITPDQHTLIFNESKLIHKAATRSQRKLKNKELKKKIAAAKSKCEQNLPDLLSKSELCLAEVSDRSRRKSEVLDVKNPPPSPVTDVHENSSDDTDNIKQEIEYPPSNSVNIGLSRTILNYEDNCFTDDFNMELF